MNMRWDQYVHCDVDITVPLMIGTLSIADLEVTVTVFRNGDDIELDDSEIIVHGWRGPVRSSCIIGRSCSSAEEHAVFDAVIHEINKREYDTVFAEALDCAESGHGQDRDDWGFDRALEAAE